MLYRPCRYNELNACAALVARGTSAPLQKDLPRIWRTWLVEERATLFVVDELSAEPAAFVACAFVSDEALARLCAERAPTSALYASRAGGPLHGAVARAHPSCERRGGPQPVGGARIARPRAFLLYPFAGHVAFAATCERV